MVRPVSIMSSTTKTLQPFRLVRLSPPITLISPVESSFWLEKKFLIVSEIHLFAVGLHSFNSIFSKLITQ